MRFILDKEFLNDPSTEYYVEIGKSENDVFKWSRYGDMEKVQSFCLDRCERMRAYYPRGCSWRAVAVLGTKHKVLLEYN